MTASRPALTPSLYRVFPHLADADPHDPGGALFIPPQGGGRLDNPALYSVLYLSDHAAGAIAESFGRFPEWTPAILAGSPSLPGSVRSLARFRIPAEAPICDLDDCARLQELGLRPSQVVLRDYDRSRAWARQIFEKAKWIGVRWWSYYDPRWGSIGLWQQKDLELEDISPLTLQDQALQDAARSIARRIVP